MFTIQTAVTVVTAGLASSLFGDFISIEVWTAILLAICLLILILGKYSFLDRFMKYIVITLTITTLIAVAFAFDTTSEPPDLSQVFPRATEFGFLIAFMGWMPAPLDISVWHSLWAIEKRKNTTDFDVKSSLFDFNVGYTATIIIGLGFLALGAIVMFNSVESFSPQAGAFSNQLISMYTSSLGDWSFYIIAIAAFTTMLSTSLTTLDASPRAMAKTSELIFKQTSKPGYVFWILTLTIGTLIIFFFFQSEMGLLVKIATILSFLTAPFYAIINYRLICSKYTPKEWRPSIKLHVMSCLGILFLIGFSIWYLSIL